MKPPGFEFLATAIAQGRWPLARPEPVLRPRRILLVRLNRIGDLICALPLYRGLERSFPDAQIDWLLSSRNDVLAPFLRVRGEIFKFKKSIGRYFLNRTLLRSLQRREYDLVIAVKGGYDALLAWTALASGANERRGYVPSKEPSLGFAFNRRFPLPPTHSHQVEKGLGLARDLISQPSDDISLEISTAARAKIKCSLNDLGIVENTRFVVFQISSTKRVYCQWPVEHFAELGKQFVSQGTRVCINTLPADLERATRLSGEIGPNAPVVSFADMGQYLGLLERAAIVIGADGGGIHLAAAMGTRTVAFFAESSPEKWRPWGGDHIQFYTANRDLREITPARVEEEISRKGWL